MIFRTHLVYCVTAESRRGRELVIFIYRGDRIVFGLVYEID